MKKLVLHSDQIYKNTLVDEVFFKYFGERKPRIAYIPSQTDLDRKYYTQKIEWYRQFGIDELFYFDVDLEYDEGKITELLSCDAIFLSGGNTYYFLYLLKKRNLIPVLNDFVEKGGFLIGLSAGSILMSNTIRVTTVDDDLGGDQNTVGLDDYSALGLNDFDFFPHFDIRNEVISNRLKEYSIKNNSVIYCCKDGDGIIVDEESTRFIGEILKIENGGIEPVLLST